MPKKHLAQKEGDLMFYVCTKGGPIVIRPPFGVVASGADFRIKNKTHNNLTATVTASLFDPDKDSYPIGPGETLKLKVVATSGPEVYELHVVATATMSRVTANSDPEFIIDP